VKDFSPDDRGLVPGTPSTSGAVVPPNYTLFASPNLSGTLSGWFAQSSHTVRLVDAGNLKPKAAGASSPPLDPAGVLDILIDIGYTVGSPRSSN